MVETDEVAWLENDALGGFRVWQLIFVCFGGVLSIGWKLFYFFIVFLNKKLKKIILF